MKKISQNEILQAILNEALTIKRKKELFKEAQKINKELKKLNEYGHPGAMLGHGFKNYEGPSPVMGLVTTSNYEEEKPEGEECGCELDQFPKLEKDIEEFGGDENEIESSSEINDIQSLKDENEKLKAQLAQIQDAVGALNEGLWDKTKAGYQAIKTGAQAAVKAGKEAGQQQYQQTRQSQDIATKKQEITSLLSQAKAKAMQNGKIDYKEIQNILSQAGYKYIGGANPSVVTLEEGEEVGTIEGLEEGLGGFLKGAAKKVGGDISKGVSNVAGKVANAAGNVAGKVAGAAQNVVGKVGQYVSDINSAGQQGPEDQNKVNAEKAAAQAEHQKQMDYIGGQYDKVINLLSQVK